MDVSERTRSSWACQELAYVTVLTCISEINLPIWCFIYPFYSYIYLLSPLFHSPPFPSTSKSFHSNFYFFSQIPISPYSSLPSNNTVPTRIYIVQINYPGHTFPDPYLHNKDWNNDDKFNLQNSKRKEI